MERRNFLKGLSVACAGVVATVLGGKKSVGENIPGEILELKAEPQGGYFTVGDHRDFDKVVQALKRSESNGALVMSDMFTPMSDCSP